MTAAVAERASVTGTAIAPGAGTAAGPAAGGLGWEQLVGLSPRPRCRVDVRNEEGGWAHRYRSAPLPSAEPVEPWALHLADEAGVYRLVCFDLDVSRGDVAPDLGYLLELLERAGAEVVVVESGPGGGRHVWVAAGHGGIEAARMGALARALGRRLPTLDIGLLCNAPAGAARPPGSPHRDGGRSRLLEPTEPGRALARLQEGKEGWAGRLETILALDLPLDAMLDVEPAATAAFPTPLTPSSSPATSPSPTSTSVPVSRAVIEVDGGPALAGRERALSPAGAAALATVPVGDCSAVLRRVLVAVALARWRWPRVRALLDTDPASTPGLEHVRSQRQPSGGRRARAPGEAVAVLVRQWRRAVAYAATLPAPVEDELRDDVGQADQELAERVAATHGVIEALQAAAAADPGRWTGPSGPADRAVLDALCLTAARSLRTVVALDVRRAAAQSGVSKSAAARGLHRLAWDGWIALEEPAEGRAAARWRLLHPSPTAEPVAGAGDADVRPEQGTGSGSAVGFSAPATEPATPPAVTASDEMDLSGGTQGNPPPTGEIPLAVWIAHLSRRVVLRTADLFCPRMEGGLGHHAASTAVAVLDLTSGLPLQALHQDHGSTGGAITSIDSTAVFGQVVACSGYSADTVAAHLDALHDARVAERIERPGTRRGARTHSDVPAGVGWRLRPKRLAAAARARGVHGYHAARARVWVAESAAWAWWCDELEWLRAPRREQLPRPGQRDLWPTDGPRRQLGHRGRYPRRPGPDGRLVPDHAAARQLLLAEHGAVRTDHPLTVTAS